MNKENIHPNISADANYTAIDDPNFFQKYVWVGLEKTLTKRYQALEATNNEVVMYNSYLPILPYFNCSAGFTLSAEEKRWWTDTPYLKSVYDFDTCDDFAWHGVWLAGKWAERFAKQWMTYDQILKYYYDGINITKIK
jgi:peptidoglycan hydrolase-like amidase